ncbi:uncharacterized protein F5Z01DRAFT_646442 [Emericellopsis atlantica]|uniref:Uncharacterized protein n=1 Tax=Emericellopsis atlantica TaxID=2614577 RepID=A0A9P8CS19_9HYPO|nr:uncharacterized protein F5Z01DRAFT_646442 [Emericellopsis atlantica]KAG9257594.1 hypothetical protein F5Z01DRAFT_646442 [Emericellopsis atlantica]
MRIAASMAMQIALCSRKQALTCTRLDPSTIHRSPWPLASNSWLRGTGVRNLAQSSMHTSCSTRYRMASGLFFNHVSHRMVSHGSRPRKLFRLCRGPCIA